LALLKHVFSVAIRQWEWLSTNPVSKIPMEYEPSRKIFMNEDQFNAILEVCDERIKPMVVIAAETGLRIFNVVYLKASEVDLFGKGIKETSSTCPALPPHLNGFNS